MFRGARIPGLPAALAVAAVLGGCMLAKPPEQPKVQSQALPGVATPPAWQSAGAAAGDVQARWLATFEDPRLDALVQEALANNPDLAAAAARVEQAAAYVESAASGLYPQVNAIGNIAGDDGSNGTLNFGGIFASWELDLWGRVRAGRAGAEYQLLSSQFANQYARQSIAAMVARAWFLTTEARLQKEMADDMVVTAEALVRLSGDRQRIGIGNDFDVAAARASLATYQDAAEQLGLSYRLAVQALEVLVGRYPATALEVPADLPAPPGPIPVGLPSQLLERRPDVVAAERRIAAAFYRVEETKAARLPTISLTGSFSSVSSDLVVLKERDDPVWGFGGRATVPLYLGGRLQSQVKVRTAEQKEAVAEYGRAGAKAFSEVEQALSSVYALDRRRPLVEQSVTENQRALDLAQDRYKVGIDDLRSVEEQQLRLFSARSSLLRVRSEQLVQRVNLHLALGGDFQ